MKRIVQISQNDLRRLKNVIETRGATYISIISANSWIIFSAGAPEFNRTFILDNSEIEIEQTINYRVPVEVFNLMMLSDIPNRVTRVRQDKGGYGWGMSQRFSEKLNRLKTAEKRNPSSERMELGFGGGNPNFDRIDPRLAAGKPLIGKDAVGLQTEQFKNPLAAEFESYDEVESGSTEGYYGRDLYLVFEEITSRDTESTELAIYWKLLSYDEVQKELASLNVENRDVVQLGQDSDIRDWFRIPRGQEYDIQPKLEWFSAWKNGNLKRSELNVLGNLRYLTDVSRMFKTGVYLKSGLAYTDSSKTGVEMYRRVEYFGPDILFTYGVINGLSDFAKTIDEQVYLAKSGDYAIALTKEGYLMSWRNIRFSMEPNIEDLQKASYSAVYETDYEPVVKIFNSIAVTKASQINLKFEFGKDAIRISDTVKGSYRFSIPFENIAGIVTEKNKEVMLNFNILKAIFAVKSQYNTLRFFVYKKFVRIDLINKYQIVYDEMDDEDTDVKYDSDNKMILVVGKI